MKGFLSSFIFIQRKKKEKKKILQKDIQKHAPEISLEQHGFMYMYRPKTYKKSYYYQRKSTFKGTFTFLCLIFT